MSYQEQTTQDQTVAPIRDEKLATHDLFETAAADPSLRRFVDLVTAASLDALLRGPDLLTVLAPVNDAFDETRDPVDLARDHIVRGAWTADELKVSKSVKTLTGRVLTVGAADGDILIAGARVLRRDLQCTKSLTAC